MQARNRPAQLAQARALADRDQVNLNYDDSFAGFGDRGRSGRRSWPASLYPAGLFAFWSIWPYHTPSTITPIERAEPAKVRTAASHIGSSHVFCLVLAISSNCSRVILPTLTFRGLAEPLSSLAAFLISTAAGGDLTTKLKLLSANAVITTGRGKPRFDTLGLGVKRLAEFHDVQTTLAQCRTNWRDGLALPAGTCSLMKPTIFLRHLSSLRISAWHTLLV